MPTIDLHGVTDADIWAREFLSVYPTTAIGREDGVETDTLDILRGWFANAIESGRRARESNAS